MCTYFWVRAYVFLSAFVRIFECVRTYFWVRAYVFRVLHQLLCLGFGLITCLAICCDYACTWFRLSTAEPTLLAQFPVNDTTVLEGDNLTINCTVEYPDGADNPLMVSWMSTSVIDPDSNENSANLTVTSVLQLDNIQPGHAGFYTCVYAFDTITSYFGEPFELIVQCKCMDVHVRVAINEMSAFIANKKCQLDFTQKIVWKVMEKTWKNATI